MSRREVIILSQLEHTNIPRKSRCRANYGPPVVEKGSLGDWILNDAPWGAKFARVVCSITRDQHLEMVCSCMYRRHIQYRSLASAELQVGIPPLEKTSDFPRRSSSGNVPLSVK